MFHKLFVSLVVPKLVLPMIPGDIWTLDEDIVYGFFVFCARSVPIGLGTFDPLFSGLESPAASISCSVDMV